jgi:hypothetical protein
MAASMCDADCVPRVINCGACRSVRQTCVFTHWKCVHVSSRQYGLTFTVTKNADDSRTTDFLENLIAEFLHFRGYETGRFGFLKTQLWIRMYVLIYMLLPYGGIPQTGQNR